ncbi:globin [Ammoniphilus sp. 3BR4]|uniref:globin domain-containing protein n=1 Tax=Ammoniphilus sp. 3BR4 TaxID=3158265 RepID=UPI0034654744
MNPSFDKSPYELIGGAETVGKLVNAFYDLVAVHPELSPIFPKDLTETREKQYLFLTQFFGGPLLYSEQHGHPMLRARHLPFPITPKRAEAWLSCMNQAMEQIGLEGPIRDFMFGRLTQTAYHMVNRPAEE